MIDLKLLIDLGRGGAIYWSIWPSGEQIIDRFGPRGGELLVDLAVWERIIGRSGRLGSELLVDLVVGEPNGAQSANGAQIEPKCRDFPGAFGGHFSLKSKRFARYFLQNMSFRPF